MSKVLGIDLGTTISKMASISNGEPKCLENREGSTLTPSFVALGKNNERLTGISAKRQAVTNPKNTIFAVKRIIGRRFKDLAVQKELKRLPYEARARKDGGIEIKMGEKWHSPIEISSMILQKLKADAEEKLGDKIESVVITCPANFDDAQRKATKTAAVVAGFKVLRIINEPTAAALAYGFGKKESKKVVVYDFGGGTFDVTVLNVSPDVVEVLSTGGESHLGGEDFDQKIIEYIVAQFKKDNGIDLLKDTLAVQRLKEAAEKAKIELSSAMETEINLPFVSSDASGPKHLYYKITRSQFENEIRSFIERSIERTKKTIAEAKINKQDVDEIVLVGGTTLIPAVRTMVKDYFGKEANKSINPEEVVARGASIQAEILIAKQEGRAPEGDIKSVLLLDVTPLSMGIETLGGINTIMIPKNTTVPTGKTQVFSTAADNQPSVEIHVLQGEREMAVDNRTLGRFVLTGIPPASRGVPQVEVVFDVDASGILTVTAKDRATGKSQSIRIEGSVGLSKEEVERIKKEAEVHNQEDAKKKELVVAQNTADTLIYTCEKTLKDTGDKVSDELKKEIQEKVEKLKKLVKEDSIEDIKTTTDELSQIIQKVGAQMYEKTKEQDGETTESEPENKTKEAEEGDYKEE